MKQKNISQVEALALCSRQEGHFFDRKAKELDGKKIQKIAVAFANADGGDFVLGIKDDRDELEPNNAGQVQPIWNITTRYFKIF